MNESWFRLKYKLWWEFLTVSNFVILDRGRGSHFSLKCSNTSKLPDTAASGELWPTSTTDRHFVSFTRLRCPERVLTNHLPSSKLKLTTSPTCAINRHWHINHLWTLWPVCMWQQNTTFRSSVTSKRKKNTCYRTSVGKSLTRVYKRSTSIW